jgi:hypothetical protein
MKQSQGEVVLVVGEEVPVGEHRHFAAAEVPMPIEPTSFKGVDEANHQFSQLYGVVDRSRMRME